MVTAEQNNVPREIKLDCKQQDADLDAEDAAVHVIAKEEVVEAAWFSSLGDHVEQVSVLTVDVADNTDRLFNLDKVCL